MADGTQAGWTGYYAWSSGRAPRSLLLAACEALGAGQGRVAVTGVCRSLAVEMAR